MMCGSTIFKTKLAVHYRWLQITRPCTSRLPLIVRTTYIVAAPNAYRHVVIYLMSP